MSILRTIRTVEMKLANGTQNFSAHEVSSLLNEIRILRKLLKQRGQAK